MNDPDYANSNYTADWHDTRNAKLLKRVTLVLGGVIIVAVLITIVAHFLGK